MVKMEKWSDDKTPRVLFEDEWVCVIDKPAGMVVNEAESTAGRATVQAWHWARLDRPAGEGEFFEKGGVVHRLDKDTSGVMVLAKTAEAYEKLKRQFLERKVIKKYMALARGMFNEKEGVISAVVERHPVNKQKWYVPEEANPARMAVTEWKAVREWPERRLTLLELTPHTGRTHQLRVHLKHLSRPIAGDPIYGGRKQYREYPRLWLHARSLEFMHPQTGEKRKFEAEVPEELERTLP